MSHPSASGGLSSAGSIQLEQLQSLLRGLLQRALDQARQANDFGLQEEEEEAPAAGSGAVVPSPSFAWPPVDLHLRPVLLDRLHGASRSSAPTKRGAGNARQQARGDFTTHVVVKVANAWQAWKRAREKERGKAKAEAEAAATAPGAVPTSSSSDTVPSAAAAAPAAAGSSASSSGVVDLSSRLASWSSLLRARFLTLLSSADTPALPELSGLRVDTTDKGYVNMFLDERILEEMLGRRDDHGTTMNAASLPHGRAAVALSASPVAALPFAASSFPSPLSHSAASSSSLPPASATSGHLASATSFLFSTLGRIRSVFKEKHGTPRQGAVVPQARGSLTLEGGLEKESLDGLADFSHVWLMFVFHQNGPTPFISSKVKPPRLGGKKVGMFATRSPHRPNPIGLSLAKIDRVEGATIFLSGIDLVHGTPIIDVKPYHPADCVQTYRMPQWMQEAPVKCLRVEWTEAAMEQFRQGCSAGLEFYSAAESSLVFELIQAILEQDPRTLHAKANHHGGVSAFTVDRLDVYFKMQEETPAANTEAASMTDDAAAAGASSSFSSPASLPTAVIFKVTRKEPATASNAPGPAATAPRLRTREWLESVNAELQSGSGAAAVATTAGAAMES